MAAIRTARTRWEGGLLEGGTGEVTLESSGLGTFGVSWPSRTEEANGKTSPEELIAAAHSSCFSMALSARLAKAGADPVAFETRADVTFVPGTGIAGVHLTVTSAGGGLTAEQFADLAEDAKKHCPVSQALAGTTITLEAHLV